MALVDDDEIEEVRRIFAEIWRRLPSFGGPLMKVWKMVKNRLPFFGTLPFLRMSSGAMRTSASSGKRKRRCRPDRPECSGRPGTGCAGGATARGSIGQIPAAVKSFHAI
jgi:hypothetical protein